ncbi:hypothetical protein Hanom_Chr11g01022591 [Helianthus anomalus]
MIRLGSAPGRRWRSLIIKLLQQNKHDFTTLIIELITVFVPVVCQKSLFQSISLKIAISVPVVSLS